MTLNLGPFCTNKCPIKVYTNTPKYIILRNVNTEIESFHYLYWFIFGQTPGKLWYRSNPQIENKTMTVFFHKHDQRECQDFLIFCNVRILCYHLVWGQQSKINLISLFTIKKFYLVFFGGGGGDMKTVSFKLMSAVKRKRRRSVKFDWVAAFKSIHFFSRFENYRNYNYVDALHIS